VLGWVWVWVGGQVLLDVEATHGAEPVHSHGAAAGSVSAAEALLYGV
jgi:hypothetical protein